MPKSTKFKVTAEYMDTLSTETGLTHDGGDDSRLHAETMNTRSSEMNKGQYELMEDEINGYSFIGEGFEVYAWNDSSGFGYWTLRQKEDNYIQVTVAIKGKVDPKAVADAANKAFNHFQKYAREYY